MDEYIKRSAFIEAVKDIPMWGSVAAMLADSIPAADVAPVVHCKDCKHYHNHPNGLCYLHTEPKAKASGYSGDAVCVEPDDFCSYGEPKEGKSDDK